MLLVNGCLNMMINLIAEIKAMDDDEWIPALVEAGLYKMANTLIAVRCSHEVLPFDMRELHSQMSRVRNPVE